MAPGTVVHMQVHLQFPWRVYGEWVEHRTSPADVGTVCNPDHVLKLKRSVGRCRLSGMDQPTGLPPYANVVLPWEKYVGRLVGLVLGPRS